MKGENLRNKNLIVTLQQHEGELIAVIPPALVGKYKLKAGDVVTFTSTPEPELFAAPLPGSAAPSPLVALHEFANAQLQVTRRLTKKRQGILQARFAEGFTLDQLKQVVVWVSGNAFLRGSNSRNRAYDDYSYMFRSAERVEEYLRYANETAGTNQLLPQDSAPTYRII